MWIKRCLVVGVMLLAQNVIAQSKDEEEAQVPTIPGTEVFLATMRIEANIVDVGEPINVSQKTGYDSQPAFSTDGDRLYFTQFNDGQTDILSYDVVEKKRRVYQSSQESEYSPTPLRNGQGITVVRVDLNGDQHVYRMDGNNAQRFSDLKQVGYHAWHGELLWTFVLSDAPSGGDLHATLPGQPAIKVYTNIGRTLSVDEKTGYLYFIDKNTQPWQIKRIHGVHEQPSFVINLPPGVEDFAHDSQGRFWLGQGNRLYTNTEDSGWQPVAEFKVPGYSGITRVAINQNADTIAFVLNETE